MTTKGDTASRFASRETRGRAPRLVVELDPEAGLFTFTPEADAYVNEAGQASNYGNATMLRIDGTPTFRSYLRFAV